MYEWAGLMSAADTYIQTYSHAKLPAHTLIESVKCISVYNYFILLTYLRPSAATVR